ncbi:NAD(P)-binding protein [Aaosphaeria arxii CBS 175.79]|uniref:NAD(P)-binding protein n=1 Tax=Aaosphaeria arxii CBS 175.79 TaxID=1450172 RepID=A0A6A5XVU4_9PLEO|nr:NAD(P)-binding protein [Aaosphaeria arxii CBS 175.79]KAF2016831.1 NAD(P)-binding protein [Aaosphaeria arxii CBS 175.79]
MSFRSSDISDLSGQVIIVTGANVGLGLETVKQLSTHNAARIYVACRSKDKAVAAIESIDREVPNASPLEFLNLDLASFDSIKAAAAEFSAKESRLDILINNAGIMMVKEGLTKEGYEIQFGTNVIGTALFTQLLLPKLRDTVRINPQTRAVILCSAAHSQAPSDAYQFDKLKTTMKDKHTTARYTTSKLADIHYAKALAAREKAVRIIPVHPGMVATNLHHASTGTFLKPFLNVAVGFFVTPVEKGAISQIWAAVSPAAQSGQYYGPVGKVEKGSKLAQDGVLQEKLFRWVQNELKGHADVFE